jgi:paraquat-inducible protein B
MNRISEDYLRKNTQFWIVRPRVSVEGISGLNTLLSGAYIELSPGGGDKTDAFAGLETPPLISRDAKGKIFTLLTNDLGTLDVGSSVIFHGLTVGEIVGYKLQSGDPSVSIQIFINDPYTDLVHPDTKFWDASGVEVSVGAQGLKIATRSLHTIFLGGIMFEQFGGTPSASLAAAGESFPVFSDKRQAEDAAYRVRVRYLLHPGGSISGLDPGDSVTMFGETIGRVDDAHLEMDVSKETVVSVVTIAIEPERLKFVGFDAQSGGDLASRTTNFFDHLAQKGLRAQLISSNLLTGDKQVNFDYVEDAPQAKITLGGSLPEFPMAPSDDLNDLIRTAKKTLGSANTFITSPELKHAIQELDRSLANIDGITRETNAQIGPLLTQLRSFAQSADDTVKAAGSSGASGGNLPATLRELREAARSVRVLADYLESHPESLLRGKPK